MGFDYLGISEHSETAMYAGGLPAATLLAQAAEIAALEGDGCTLLSGIETDILRDGGLDYDDDVLAALGDPEVDIERLGQIARRAAGRTVNDRTRRRPMIVPVVRED